MDPAFLRVVALTHQRMPLEAVGRFHLDAADMRAAGLRLQDGGMARECFFITTCNRAELVLVAKDLRPLPIEDLLLAWKPDLDPAELQHAVRAAVVFEGDEAVRDRKSVV